MSHASHSTSKINTCSPACLCQHEKHINKIKTKKLLCTATCTLIFIHGIKKKNNTLQNHNANWPTNLGSYKVARVSNKSARRAQRLPLLNLPFKPTLVTARHYHQFSHIFVFLFLFLCCTRFSHPAENHRECWLKVQGKFLNRNDFYLFFFFP